MNCDNREAETQVTASLFIVIPMLRSYSTYPKTDSMLLLYEIPFAGREKVIPGNSDARAYRLI
jgi:hypothetical protein